MSSWSIDRIEEGWAVCEGPDDAVIRLEVSRLRLVRGKETACS